MADAPALAFQMGPAAHKARGEVAQLRHLDLQLPFKRAGALGKDIENEAGAVQHAAIDRALEVALLRRRERPIKQHDFSVMLGDERF